MIILKAGPQGRRQDKISHKPDHRKGTDVRILQDPPLTLRILMTGKRIAGIGITIQMNTPGYPYGHQAQDNSSKQGGNLHPSAGGRHPPAEKPHDHPDQRKSTQRITHIVPVPFKLGHGNRGKHGKRHRDRF